MGEIKILILDDEISILNTLRRTLTKEGFNVNCFDQPEDALSYIKDNKDIQVIISDVRMPRMTGDAFFCQVKEIAPNPIRIALSGYSEKEQLLNLINQGKIWAFVNKPWDNEDFISTLRSASEVFQIRNKKELENKGLEEKSLLLEELTTHLEALIRNQTKELDYRSDLLEELLNSRDYIELTKKFNTYLDELSHREGHNIIPLLEQSEIPPDCFALHYNNKIIGFISCEGGIKKNSDHEYLLKRFSALSAFILKQRLLESKRNGLIENNSSWLNFYETLF